MVELHREFLNPYHHRSGPLHRLRPGLKLAAALGFIFTVVLLPRMAWTAFGAAGAVLLVLAAVSRVPAGLLLKRLLMVEPFALGVALLALFQEDGPRIFAAMMAKSTLCLSCMVLLSATTRFTCLLRVLWHCRVPPLLVTTLALMHRYLFLLVEETGRLLRARRSRTFRDDRASLWQAGAEVIAELFVRSSGRAERVYAAMCARGWKT
jgi:cobalt/nickel transport system permease protein